MQLCLISRNVTSMSKLSLTTSTRPCRSYATGGKPAKKPPSKTKTKSVKAPVEKKIKSKVKQVSTSASKDSPDSTETVKRLGRKTTLEVGTAFELRSLQLLQENFSMTLNRVAGRGDGGIDLAGWWWLPRLSGLPQVSNVTLKDGLNGTGHSEVKTRIRVLAQCKAEKIKLGPNYVREMEGVLHRTLHTGMVEPDPAVNEGDTRDSSDGDVPLRPIPTVAMIISQSRFTNGAVMRAMSSPIPFMLLHLPPQSTTGNVTEAGETTDGDEDFPSLQWNPALGSAKGLLRGHLEVRWQREVWVGSPRLWWQGQPLANHVP